MKFLRRILAATSPDRAASPRVQGRPGYDASHVQTLERLRPMLTAYPCPPMNGTPGSSQRLYKPSTEYTNCLVSRRDPRVSGPVRRHAELENGASVGMSVPEVKK